MNKITIPALLLGVVMIAGAFAFMPVQEASTVHTTSATTLGADAITAAKIADDAIIAANLATGALTADAFAADAIVAATLATGALTADAFAGDAIVAATIATGAIDSSALGAGAINVASVADNSIDAGALAANAVIEIQTKRIDTVSFAAGVDPTCTSTTPFVVHYNVANLADAQTLVITGTSNAALTYTADVAANTTGLDHISGTLGGAAGETIIFTLGAAGTSAMTIVSTFGSTGTCA